MVYSCLDTVRVCSFPHENVCQPSSLQSKLRSIRTRLGWLQTVIDGQESRRALDKMLKLHRSRLDTSFCTRRLGSSQLASDLTLSRTACTGTELHCKPTRSVDQLRKVWSSPTLRSQAHCPHDVRLDTVTGISAGGSETNVTSERQPLHSKSGEGRDCRSRKPRKKKAPPQPTIVYSTVYTSAAASSATISSGTPVHSEISTPPSPRFLALLCREYPSDGKDESTTGKCSDDRRGLVKNLSGRLARKLQRSASLVNAGLPTKKSDCAGCSSRRST